MSSLVRINNYLIISFVLLELPFIWLLSNQPELTSIWRISHLVQMLILMGWLVLANQHLGPEFRRGGLWLLVALIFSFIGDVVNSRLIDLSFIVDPQIFLSIIPFAATQLIYALLFWQAAKSSPNIFQYKWLSLIAWPIITFVLWQSLLSDGMTPVLTAATLAYASMVLLMLVTSSWLWRAWGSAGLPLFAGALIFVSSDATIGFNISQGHSPAGLSAHYIWVSYIVAQCLIVRLGLIRQQEGRLHV